MKANGLSSFQALQNALSREDTGSLHYYVFDLPFLDGHDLRKAPLVERKSLLEKVLSGAPAVAALSAATSPAPATEFYGQACKLELEGIVSKRADSPYRAGRGRDWLKIKCGLRQEMVIGGYTDPGGARSGLGALLLGVYEPDGSAALFRKSRHGLRPRDARQPAQEARRARARDAAVQQSAARGRGAARALGESPARRRDRLHRMDRRRHPAPPVVPGIARGQEPEGRRARTAGRRSDEPRAASCEPQAASRKRQATSRDPRGTRQGSGRQGSCATRSRVTSHGSRITLFRRGRHQRSPIPDKVLYPEARITKRDLALYYEAVADWILPHLAGPSADARALPERLEQAMLLSEARHGGRPEGHRAHHRAGRWRQGDLHDGEFAPRARRARCRWACWSSIRGARARRSSAIPTASSSTSIRTTTCRGARSPMRRAS